MKKILAGYSFFFFSILGFAQTNLDSLKQLLPQNPNDSQSIAKYLDFARSYIDIDADSTFVYTEKIQEPAQKLGDSLLIIQVENLLGNCAQRKGDFEGAMEYYESAKTKAIALSDAKGLAMVWNNIGIIHTQSGQYNKALSAYFEAIDHEKTIGNEKGIAEGYNNIGVVHYHMGDMENTLAYLKKSMEISESLGDLQILKKGYLNIGAIHLYRKEYDQAIEFYERGLEISKAINDLNDITVAYHNLAGVYDQLGAYQKAEDLYLQALAFHEKLENQRGIALEYVNLGELAKNQKKYNSAYKYYQDALAISSEFGYLIIVEAAYAGLAEVYSAKGQNEKAYETLLDFIAIKDSLVNVENSKAFAELRTKYETAEKEKALFEEQIKTAELEKDKAKLELQSAKRSKWIVGLIAALLCLIFLAAFRIQKNKRRLQAEKDAALIAERDRGTKAVFDAQENERKRISKDLHDGVGQQMSGIKMAFQKLGKEINEKMPEKKKEVDKLSLIISESADEVRSISHQMMPKALTQLGLIDALQDLLDKTFELSDIDCQFEHFGMQDRLNERIEVSLYRIVQELINNIIKHAEASKVSVQLFKNQGKLILMIEDNGKGMKSQDGDGHGLLNIKSRLNTLHGDLNLEPSPASGTLATIRLPLT